MKKLFTFLLTIVIFFSCKEDEEIIFDADPSDVEITFEPFEGGAYMNYILPNNSEIYAIKAEYTDFTGKDIVLKGTCYSNRIKIFGFTEAEDQIPIKISLLDKDNNVSKSIIEYFNTKIHGSVEIFDGIKVKSNWDGFKIDYSTEKESNGFINIGYIGISPKTHKLSTLLVKSEPISKGNNVLSCSSIFDEKIEKVDVVVWTEDFRGNDVKKKIYKDIPVSRAEQFNCENVDFIGDSDENEKYHTSWKYLFDGDKKGLKALELDGFWEYCFKSNKKCVGEGYDPEKSVWTVDLKEAKELAYIRLYAHSPIFYAYSQHSSVLTSLRKDSKYMCPNHVKVYGTNDKTTPLEECDLLGEFYQSPTIDDYKKWNYYSFSKNNQFTVEDMDRVKSLNDAYAQINFEPTDKKHRYIKIKVIETFYDVSQSGYIKKGKGDIYMEELEVFTKKSK